MLVAHLSRIKGSQGELIVYTCSSVRCPFSKILSSETAWPIKAASMGRGKESLYKWARSHMITKMAATSIYGQTLNSKIFSRNRRSMILKLPMHYQGLKLYLVCINDYHGLTLTFFIWQGQCGHFAASFFPLIIFGKLLQSHLMEEKNLQQITKSTQDLCFKNILTRGAVCHMYDQYF